MYKLGATYNNWGDGPRMDADVFEREAREMPDDYWQMNSELNDIFRDNGSQYSNQGSLRSLPQNTKNMMGSVWGAANSAGKMINSAYGDGGGIGGGGSAAPRHTDEQLVKGDIFGTPNYQQQGGFQLNLPPEIQAEMDKWRAKKAAGTDPSKLAAYAGQYGAGVMADMNKVTQYIRSVPQELMGGIQRTMQQTLDLSRDARLRFNPNDVIGNAQLSNKHITNQAFNQPGAQFLMPEGNQKANTLLAYGADVGPDELRWANNADALTDEIYGDSIKSGQFGSTIKPAYQSSTMGWGGPSVVQTGDGDYETRLADGLTEGPHTPYTPRNNNDPNNFRVPGTGNQKSPQRDNPLNGKLGDDPNRGARMPSGYGGGRDMSNRVQNGARGLPLRGGTAQDLMKQHQQILGGPSLYGTQSKFGNNPNVVYGPFPQQQSQPQYSFEGNYWRNNPTWIN